MQDINSVLTKRIPVQPVNKSVSHEFQAYGLQIARKLNDMQHKGIYFKLAKNYPRSILEAALSFVIDSNARNKGALFMWKVKQLRVKKIIVK